MAYDGEVRINARMNTEELNSDFDRLASQIGKSLSGINLSVAGITAGLFAAGKSAVNLGMEFDATMSKVGALSGATAQEMATLKDKAREMGATTKFSATESAQAFTYLAQAGWDASQMVDGIGGIMMAAAADGADLADVANILTNAISAFGGSASDTAHYADVLATVAAASNTNISMLGESFKYAAPVAGAYGFAIEDISVSLGAMANVGIVAGSSGTAFRQILMGLQSGAEITSESFGEMIISMQNSDGTMKTWEQTTLELREAFAQMTEAEKAANAEAIAGKIGMSGLLAIVNQTEEDYLKLSSAIDSASGSAANMAAIMQQNLAGQFIILDSSIQEVGLTISGILTPAISKGVSGIQTLVDGFNALPAPAKEFATLAGVTATALGASYTAFKTLTAAKQIYAAVTGQATATDISAITASTNLSAKQTAQIASILKLNAARTAEAQATVAVSRAQERYIITSGQMTAGKQAEAAQSIKVLQAKEAEAAANFKLIDAQSARIASSTRATRAAEAEAAQSARTAVMTTKEAEAELLLIQAQNVQETATAKRIAASETLALATQQVVLAEMELAAITGTGVAVDEARATAAATLTVAKEKEALASAALSIAESEETVATASTTGARAAQTAVTEANTAANAANVFSIKALTAAMFSNPLFMIGATLAIPAIMMAVDHLTNRYEKQKEALDKLTGEYNDLQAELTDTKDKIAIVNERIKEINSADPLTVTDPNELKELEKLNAELETHVGYLEERASFKQEEARQQAAEAYKTLKEEIENEIKARDYLISSLEDETLGRIRSADAAMVAAKSVTEYNSAIYDGIDGLLEHREAITGNTKADIKLRAEIDATIDSLRKQLPATEGATNANNEYGLSIENVIRNKEAEAEATRLQEEADRAEADALREADEARKEYNLTIVNGFKAIEQEAAQSAKELAKILIENEAITRNWENNIAYLSDKGMTALAESFEVQGVEAVGKFTNELAWNMDQAEQITGMSINELIALHGKLPPAIAERLSETQLSYLEFLAASNATLKDGGEESIAAFSEAIEGGKDQAEQSAEAVGDSTTTGFEDAIPKVVTVAKKIMTDSNSAMVSELPNFEQVGRNIAAGVSEGIRLGTGPVAATAKHLVRNALNAMKEESKIESPSKEAAIIGDFLGQGVDVGLRGAIPMIEKSARDFINKTLSTMRSSGADIAQLEIDRLKASIERQEEHNKKMARMKDIASKEEAVATAKNNEERIKAEEALNETLEKYRLEDLKDQLKSKEEELKLIEEAEKERLKLEKERFDAFKTSIDEKKYYNQLSVTDEIALWEEAQTHYVENSEERKQIDKEIYKLKKELLEDIKYDEIELASDTHKTKVELINQEYIEKVRLTDEGLAAFLEANNKEIQAIIDRIALTDEETAAQLRAIQERKEAVQKASEAEKIAREEAAKAEKEAELLNKIAIAETEEERQKAHENYYKWKDDEDYKQREKERQILLKELDAEQKEILRVDKETKDAQLKSAKEYQEKQKSSISSAVKSIADTIGTTIIKSIEIQTAEDATGISGVTGSPIITAAKIDEKSVSKMLIDTENILKSFEKPLKEQSAALTKAIYDVTNRGMRQWHDMMKASIKSTYAMIEQEMTNTLRMAEAMAMAIQAAQASSASSAMTGTGACGAANIVNNFTVMPQETAYRVATVTARELRLGAY